MPLKDGEQDCFLLLYFQFGVHTIYVELFNEWTIQLQEYSSLELFYF